MTNLDPASLEELKKIKDGNFLCPVTWYHAIHYNWVHDDKLMALMLTVVFIAVTYQVLKLSHYVYRFLGRLFNRWAERSTQKAVDHSLILPREQLVPALFSLLNEDPVIQTPEDLQIQAKLTKRRRSAVATRVAPRILLPPDESPTQ